MRSGDKAKDAYANHAALEAYGRALEVAPRVVPPVAPRRLVEIHQRRGQVLLLLSRYREAVEAGERMVAIAAQAGDRRGEAEGLVDQAYAHWMMFSAPSTEDARPT